MKHQWIYSFAKLIFPNYIWGISTKKPVVYLTFDDGPIPEVTPWVLDLLTEYNAKATFFCIGDNINKHPEIFLKIYQNKHTIGNHTYNHLKGWNANAVDYVENTLKCQKEIEEHTTSATKLFRPPYGKITNKQSTILRKKGFKIIMWNVLSKDYDASINYKTCIERVLNNIKPGSIIVFHDSVKAFPNLQKALPVILKSLKQKGYSFEALY
jgi:peptidoglycan/xylan/chitin deacetylase (PgdA/CDA1 family)